MAAQSEGFYTFLIGLQSVTDRRMLRRCRE